MKGSAYCWNLVPVGLKNYEYKFVMSVEKIKFEMCKMK